MNRRRFLGAGLVASTLATKRSLWGRPSGANDAIRIAVVGLGIKGAGHVAHLQGIPDVRIAALCDVDPLALGRQVAQLANREQRPFATTDFRCILDRPDIDAVLLATGTYWHATMTAWACQAGKDVYVEKPVGISLWEGQQMVAAATRHQRIVQVGIQMRSDNGLREAEQACQSGRWGKVLGIHAVSYNRRPSIGRRPAWRPNHLDYDLFCGPSPLLPLTRNLLHYDWHWMWATGGGEIANIGVHVLDIARRFLPSNQWPKHVLCVGGRFGVDDVGETPNTAIAIFDYPQCPVLFEARGLPKSATHPASDSLKGLRTGVVVQCENGYFAGYVGGSFFDHAGRRLEFFRGDGGRSHFENFLTAMRTRRTSDLAASIQQGHQSTALCHYANLSYRLGEISPNANFQPEALTEIDAFSQGIRSIQHHLRENHIPAEAPLQMGCWLQTNGSAFTLPTPREGSEPIRRRCEAWVRGSHRLPFVPG